MSYLKAPYTVQLRALAPCHSCTRGHFYFMFIHKRLLMVAVESDVLKKEYNASEAAEALSQSIRSFKRIKHKHSVIRRFKRQRGRQEHCDENGWPKGTKMQWPTVLEILKCLVIMK